MIQFLLFRSSSLLIASYRAAIPAQIVEKNTAANMNSKRYPLALPAQGVVISLNHLLNFAPLDALLKLLIYFPLSLSGSAVYLCKL